MSVAGQTASLRINDFAVSIVNGHLVAILLVAFHVLHVSQCQLWYVSILVELQQLLDFTLHLVGIYQLVNQLHLHQFALFCQRYKAVSISVQ